MKLFLFNNDSHLLRYSYIVSVESFNQDSATS